MSADLTILPSELVQGPIASNLTLKEAVQCAATNRWFRANMIGLFQDTGKVLLNKFSFQANTLQKEKNLSDSFSFEETKEIVAAARLVQGVKDDYFELDEDDQNAEGVFERNKKIIADHLDNALGAFIQIHFPSVTKDDLIQRVAGGFLFHDGEELHTVFRRILAKLHVEKASLVSKATKLCKEYLVNNDGDILLKAAKLARLFPNFTIHDLRNTDKLCLSVEQLENLTESINLDQRFDRVALALFVPEKNIYISNRFHTVERLELSGPGLDFLGLGHNFNFLRSFTSLSRLEITSGEFDHLPPVVLSLPIKELDIRYNNFTALPPIPKSTTRLRFSHNPIDAASTANNNLHEAIRDRFVEQYQYELPPLSNTEMEELKNLVFSEMVTWGAVRKGSYLSKIPFRVQGKLYNLPKERIFEAYLLAVTQGPLNYTAQGEEQRESS